VLLKVAFIKILSYDRSFLIFFFAFAIMISNNTSLLINSSFTRPRIFESYEKTLSHNYFSPLF